MRQAVTAVAHLPGESFVYAGGADPLEAGHGHGGASHDVLGKAEGIDAHVPEAAATPFGDEAYVVPRSHGEVEAAAHEADLAEVAGIYPLPHDFCLWMMAIHERFRQHAPGLPAGGDHGVHVRQAGGHRFFAEDVNAGIHRPN